LTLTPPSPQANFCFPTAFVAPGFFFFSKAGGYMTSVTRLTFLGYGQGQRPPPKWKSPPRSFCAGVPSLNGPFSPYRAIFPRCSRARTPVEAMARISTPPARKRSLRERRVPPFSSFMEVFPFVAPGKIPLRRRFLPRLLRRTSVPSSARPVPLQPHGLIASPSATPLFGAHGAKVPPLRSVFLTSRGVQAFPSMQ